MAGKRHLARSIVTTFTLLVALVYVANLPFYAGSKFGDACSWRMEHGRITVERAVDTPSTQSFYVAYNTEGLRFWFRGRFHDVESWSVTIPLWVILGPSVVLCVWIWRRSSEGARAV